MKKILSAFIGCCLLTVVTNISHAATLYWGTNSTAGAGVAGTWTTVTTSQRWSTSSSGPFTGTWTNSLGSTNTARFVAPAGTVAGNVAITVNKIQTDVAAYSFSGPTAITFAGTDAGIEANHTSGTTTLAGLYAGTGGLVKSGTGRLELNNANATLAKLKITGGFTTMAAPSRLTAAPGSFVADWLEMDGGGFAHATATGMDLGSNRGVTIRAGGGYFGASGANQTIIPAPIVGTEGGAVNVGSPANAPFYSPYNLGCTLILSNINNSWDGPTRIYQGSLTLGNSGVIPDTSDVTVNGGTFALNGMTETIDSLIVSGGTVSGGGTLTGSAYDFRSGTVSAVLSGSAIATKTTAGSIDLSGAQLYTGGFNHNNGTVRVNSTTALGAAGSAVVLEDGVTLATTSTTARSLNYAFTINGNITLGQNSGGTASATLAGTVDLGSGYRTLTISNAANTVSGVVSGSGGIVKAGTGTLTLTAVNTYSGNTTNTEGTISIDGDSTFGNGTGTLVLAGGNLSSSATRTASTAPVANPVEMTTDTVIQTTSTAGTVDLNFSNDSIVGTGGTLTFTNAAASVGNFRPRFTGGGFNFSRPIALLNGETNFVTLSLFSSNSAADQTFSGEISGNGSILRSASSGTGGNSILSASNSFTGGILLNNGHIGVGNDYALSTGSITANGGGLLASGAARTVTNNITFTGSLSTAGNTNLNLSGTMILGDTNRFITANNTEVTTVSGPITSTATAGAIALTKAGTGVLNIASANTYAGDTEIFSGNLRISNGSGSALGTGNVLIGVSGTLSGTGTISGVVSNAGAISPGASPGTISTGSEDWAGGGSYLWEINDATGTAGADPGWDKIAITGGLNISATPGSPFVINITSFGGDAANFNNSIDQSWVIATTTEGITNFNPNSFVLVDNFSNAQGTGGFNIAMVGNDLVIKFVHPPVINVQPVGLTKVFGESAAFSVDASSVLAYQWRKNGSDISGATDSSYAIGSVLMTDAGNYDVVLTNASGYVISSTAVLVVNKADQTINFGALGNKVYGDPDFAVSATASSGLPVSFSIFSGPATILNDTNVHLTGSGAVVVRASQAGDGNYNAATNVDQGFSVVKAVLTVTAANTNAYGSVPVLTPTYIGFLLGDNAGNSLTGSPSLSTLATTNSPVSGSPYEITVGAGDLASDNYSFDFTNGTLTVTGAVLTVTANDTNRLYGAANPAFTASYSGFVNNEDESVLSGSPSLTTTGDPTNSIGNYPINGAVGTLAAANYTFSFVSGTLTVNVTPLSVTPDNISRAFGETNPVLTGVIVGIQNGDAITANYSTDATQASPPGPYTIVPELVDPDTKLGNYNVTTNHGILTVLDPPVITAQPSDVTTNVGATVVFSVSATGNGTLTYQWRKDTNNLSDGGIISGATSESLTLTGVSVTDSGDYNVIVDSIGGATTSSNATLVVIAAPDITTHPISQSKLEGESVTFTVVATGGSLDYQWYFNASPLAGATDSSLTISHADPTNVGPYYVSVTNVVGATNSLVANLAVTADNDLPKVVILLPKKNIGTNQQVIQVTGTVKDSKTLGSGIVQDVYYKLNGGATNTVSLTNLTLGSYTWGSSNAVVLVPGANSLEVWAKDLAGNESLHLVHPFYFDSFSSVGIVVNHADGHVKSGTLLTFNAGSNSVSTLKVGRTYKFDAYVTAGTTAAVFTNWVTTPVDAGSSTNNWVQKSSRTFTIQSNMVIYVNFMTNPFTALAGTYNGLFAENAGVTHETAGFIQVKVKNKSSYSGYLLFDGVKRPFSGKLKTDGTVTKEVTRTKTILQDNVSLSLSVNLDPSTELVTGTVSATNGAWTSLIEADKMVYTKDGPFDTTNDGSYTLQIPTGPGAPASSPGGIGYGTVTNSPDGFAKLGGLLGEGEKLSQKVSLSRYGNWPLYVGLYKNTAKVFKGSLQGWVKFTEGDFGPSSNNVVNWIKKGDSEVVDYYPGGFSNSVEIAGSPYVAPLSGLPIPVNVGDMIILTDGNLSEPVTNLVTAVVDAKVTLSKSNTVGIVNSATIVFKGKDGTFKGGFLNPAIKTATQGVVLQNTNAAAGFFKGNSGQSGTVRLE